jgi:hypothetical protein
MQCVATCRSVKEADDYILYKRRNTSHLSLHYCKVDVHITFVGEVLHSWMRLFFCLQLKFQCAVQCRFLESPHPDFEFSYHLSRCGLEKISSMNGSDIVYCISLCALYFYRNYSTMFWFLFLLFCYTILIYTVKPVVSGTSRDQKIFPLKTVSV